MTDGAAGRQPRDRPPASGPRRGSSPPRTRQPVTQRRYLVRRFVVLAAFGLVVFGAVRVVGTLTESDGPGDVPVAASNTTTLPSAATGATAPGATVAPATAAPTTAAPAGPPSAESPARVLIVGDSDAGTFGPYLQQLIDGDDEVSRVTSVTLDYKVSSGLARPDFFDWPHHLRNKLAELDPSIVIVTFGGNDSQALTAPCDDPVAGCGVDAVTGMPETDSEDWTALYIERVTEIVEIVGDRQLIWVGIPNDDSPEVTARLRLQDQAVRAALEAFPDVRFVDTWDLFDGINGGWAAIVPDPRDGRAKPIRADDGFHLNQTGAEILALSIFDELESVLDDMGAAES